MSLELNSLIAPAATFILGIGAVWAFLSKFTPAARKYLKIAKEALDLLNKVLESIEDKEVTSTEVEDIRKEANELMVALGKK